MRGKQGTWPWGASTQDVPCRHRWRPSGEECQSTLCTIVLGRAPTAMSLARLTQISSLFVPIETSQEVEGSHTLTGKKAKRGKSMSPLIAPFEGGGAETIETSGGEDAALATITTTQYDLSVTLQ